jgi:hypothetical protein
VIPNFGEFAARAGHFEIVFRFSVMFFTISTMFFREEVDEPGVPWDGTSPKAWDRCGGL